MNRFKKDVLSGSVLTHIPMENYKRKINVNMYCPNCNKEYDGMFCSM